MTAPRTTVRDAEPAPPAQRLRGWPWIAAIVVGVALAAAPLVFGMFERAPGGGRMLDDFRPFMTGERLDAFDAHLDTIDAATVEATGRLSADVAAVDGPPLPATEEMATAWPGIEDDMRGMLGDIRDNLDEFAAVDALPPFPLFPWFFVLPGVLAAAVAAAGLRRTAAGVDPGWLPGAVIALGVGLVAAPAVFQMFTRAPAGAAMIDDLRPLMTRDNVTTMQHSFLTIGSMESELRTTALPAVADGDAAETYPAVASLNESWPRISSDMAPMIGAMADNLDEFEGIDALPPFWLFPWFFVVPGIIAVGLGAAARRGRLAADPDVDPDIDATAATPST